MKSVINYDNNDTPHKIWLYCVPLKINIFSFICIFPTRNFLISFLPSPVVHLCIFFDPINQHHHSYNCHHDVENGKSLEEFPPRQFKFRKNIRGEIQWRWHFLEYFFSLARTSHACHISHGIVIWSKKNLFYDHAIRRNEPSRCFRDKRL